MSKVNRKYFDKDYWTQGTKSGYTTKTYNREDYLNEAKAQLLIEVYDDTFHEDDIEYWLEAGCAFGWVIEQVRMNAWSIQCLGFDISKYAIKNAAKIAQEWIMQSDGLDSRLYKPNCFDVIYSFETAEHVPEDSVQQWMDNLYYWLKPGGKLFITICLGHNNIRGLDDNDKSHQTLQTRLWWENIILKAGFEHDGKSFDKALSTIVETKEMSIRGTPENIIEKYGLHLFTWEKPIS